jgi:histone acetyltransferase
MECHLSAQVSYTEFPVMIRQQKAAVDSKVRELSNAHIVYPGGAVQVECSWPTA